MSESNSNNNVAPMRDKRVSLSLTSMAREDAPSTPFVVDINGELVEFNDPVELDYRVVDNITDPDTFARYCVAEDSRSFFRRQRLPLWQFRELMQAYTEHYRVEEIMGNPGASRS